jgi:predicted nucleotide-binding protein
MRNDDKQVGIVSFSLGERVYETQYLDWDEHIRRSNTSLINDWEFAKSENRRTKSVSLENEVTLIPAVDGPLSLFVRDTDGNSDNRKVFVVHGHAEKPKQAVADFLHSRGLEPIILHQQPNEGRTIIEKFEKHSDVVGFAVVLLTPDDFGGPAGHPEKELPRARQNVVLELGYFMGKLGRGRVCCLYVDGVELPSDYQGVLWLPYDDSGAWRDQLAKELAAAGIAFDSQALAAAAKKKTLTL